MHALALCNWFWVHSRSSKRIRPGTLFRPNPVPTFAQQPIEQSLGPAMPVSDFKSIQRPIRGTRHSAERKTPPHRSGDIESKLEEESPADEPPEEPGDCRAPSIFVRTSTGCSLTRALGRRSEGRQIRHRRADHRSAPKIRLRCPAGASRPACGARNQSVKPEPGEGHQR